MKQTKAQLIGRLGAEVAKRKKSVANADACVLSASQEFVKMREQWAAEVKKREAEQQRVKQLQEHITKLEQRISELASVQQQYADRASNNSLAEARQAHAESQLANYREQCDHATKERDSLAAGFSFAVEAVKGKHRPSLIAAALVESVRARSVRA